MNGPVVTNSPPAIQWRDYYSVGNRDLDGQHQEIIFIINWLYEVIWQGDDQAALPTLMRRLSEYTYSHFAHEEAMMCEAGFPGYVGHKEVRDKLASDTSDLLFGSLVDERPHRERAASPPLLRGHVGCRARAPGGVGDPAAPGRGTRYGPADDMWGDRGGQVLVFTAAVRTSTRYYGFVGESGDRTDCSE